MKVKVFNNAEELGRQGGNFAAGLLKQTMADKGRVRLLLSTGASQFETLQSLVKADVDWSKVEVFHLDEYIGLPLSHPASFRNYLKERFINQVHPGKVHLVDGEGNIEETIAALTKEVRKEPINLALIGIGENGHIAFNDPPADFETKEAFIVVNLDEKCKKQQVGEGWFKTVDDVPEQAISMSVYQIMQSEVILSCVPHKVKAEAVKATLEKELTNLVPATMLKNHQNVQLYLDQNSASLVDEETLKKYL